MSNSMPWYFYLRPFICIFGLISNTINSIIFYFSPKLKHSTYRLMLVISIVDMFYLSILLTSSFISDCRQYCPHTKFLYSVKQFELYAEDYFSSCLALFVIFIEIMLSIKRYLIMSNSPKFRSGCYNNLTIAITIGISLIYYLPVIYVKEIVESPSDFGKNNNRTAFILIKSDFGKSNIGKVLPVVLASIRLFLATILLSAINVLTTLKFKYRIKHKVKVKTLQCVQNSTTNITNDTVSPSSTKISSSGKAKNYCTLADSKANKNITHLVFWITIIFIAGATPYQIFFIIDNIIDDDIIDTSSYYVALYTVSTVSLAVSHAANIFIYYSCNSLYRETFEQYFRKVFRCKI